MKAKTANKFSAEVRARSKAVQLELDHQQRAAAGPNLSTKPALTHEVRDQRDCCIYQRCAGGDLLLVLVTQRLAQSRERPCETALSDDLLLDDLLHRQQVAWLMTASRRNPRKLGYRGDVVKVKGGSSAAGLFRDGKPTTASRSNRHLVKGVQGSLLPAPLPR
jgi:hypothetical protein